MIALVALDSQYSTHSFSVCAVKSLLEREQVTSLQKELFLTQRPPISLSYNMLMSCSRQKKVGWRVQCVRTPLGWRVAHHVSRLSHLAYGAGSSFAGVLLIAGGIGITPMRTMFAECIARGIPVTLLYSVRLLEDAAFLAEFQEVWEKLHPVHYLQLEVTPAHKLENRNKIRPLVHVGMHLLGACCNCSGGCDWQARHLCRECCDVICRVLQHIPM